MCQFYSGYFLQYMFMANKFVHVSVHHVTSSSDSGHNVKTAEEPSAVTLR